MTKTTLVTILCLAVLSIKAQAQAITFDSSNAPKPGTIWYTVNDTFYSSLTVTGPGAKQTWKYDTALHHADTSITAFKKASTSVYHKLFPKASLVFTSNGNDSAPAFGHYDSKGYYEDGAYGNYSGLYYDTLRVSSPYITIPFGLTYLDSVKNVSKLLSVFNIFGSIYTDRIVVYENFKADAYGSLTTPSGTYPNVLRIKNTLLEVDSSFIDTLGKKKLTLITKTRSSNYMWVQNNPKQPVVMEISLDSNAVINGASYSFVKGVGTKDIMASPLGVIVSPNPANNILTIRPMQSYLMYDAELVNVLGQKIWTGEHLTGTLQLPVSMLPNGNYFCHITQNGSSITKQVVITH